MLPETIHKDDIAWFKQRTVTLPIKYRVQACQAYSQVWQQAHDAEPLLHCKENAGRFAANCRLRSFVTKVQSR